MKTILLRTALVFSLLTIVFIACKKNGFDNKPRLQVYLMDAPGDYQSVYIDVKDVMINVTGDTVNGWQSLAGVHAGSYDLLKLVNDDDTLLADAEIPSGKIHQLRLVLGTENYVKIEGTPQLIKLETPSDFGMLSLGGRSIWFYLVFAGLVLFAVEWWLYQRRVVG